jgi:septum formation protein
MDFSLYTHCFLVFELIMRLILGSQSPRRREILEFFSLPFEQVPSYFAEELVPYDGDPIGYAKILSQGKAHSLKIRYPKTLILTADTVVYKEGKIYGKPASLDEAFQILSELNGSWHSVYTSITVLYENREYSECEETKVLFHELSESQIRSYHHSFQVTDKAGGYGIQKAGHLIVKRMEGCFYNVMGLPLNALKNCLEKVGIDLWHYLKRESL